MSLKKRIIENNNIILKFKAILVFLSLIRNNKVINFIYNLLIYIFLLMLFLYVSRILIWFKIASGNLSILDILTVLIAFILDLILFAKIISVRSNWKTLYLKYTNVLSWKTLLRKNFFFMVLFTIIISNILYIVPFLLSIPFKDFEYNNQLLILIVIETLFFMIVSIEGFFLFLLLINKGDKIKHDDSRQLIGDSVKFQFTNSKIVLFLCLIASIIFARFVSEQINNTLLGITALDLESLIIGIAITSGLFVYYMISRNVIFFKNSNLEYNIDIKSNIIIFLISIFLLINGVYFAKFLAIFIAYLPIEITDPLLDPLLDEMLSLFYTSSGGISFYNSVAIDMVVFIYFLIISIFFTEIIYRIFLNYTIKKHSAELKMDFDQITSNSIVEPLRCNGQKIIKKIFLKKLKSSNFRKHFSYFYYFFLFLTPLIFSFIITYLLISDTIFGRNTFINFTLKYYRVTIIYFIFLYVLGGVFVEVQNIHKYVVTDFINKNILYEYIMYIFVYLSITTSCLITISLRNVYQISEKYGELAPEIIQVCNYGFFLYISAYVLLKLSKKIEEGFIKAIE